jgi:hypothetical protein
MLEERRRRSGGRLRERQQSGGCLRERRRPSMCFMERWWRTLAEEATTILLVGLGWTEEALGQEMARRRQGQEGHLRRGDGGVVCRWWRLGGGQ